jgi:hypothetical protein
VQQDATPAFFSGPNRVITTIGMSVPVPLFDRNQGGIQQAQGSLVRAVEDPHRVRSDLTARFSEAFRRYDENRALLELYRNDLLPKQVQAFRAAVKRHYGAEPEKVSYVDLVQSEQSLVAVVGMYLTILGAEWQAVVDVTNFLQTDDLFQLADGTHPCNTTNLEELLQLPCCHPCSPIPAPAFTPSNLNWLPSQQTLGQSSTPPALLGQAPAMEPAPEPTPAVEPRPATMAPIEPRDQSTARPGFYPTQGPVRSETENRVVAQAPLLASTQAKAEPAVPIQGTFAPPTDPDTGLVLAPVPAVR